MSTGRLYLVTWRLVIASKAAYNAMPGESHVLSTLLLPQIWANSIIHMVRADHLTSEAPSHSLLSLVKSFELKTSKFMSVCIWGLYFWQFQILIYGKEPQNEEEQCLLWPQVSDFISVKVDLFPYMALNTTSISFYLIAFISFSHMTYKCSITWLKVPCAKWNTRLFYL